MSHNRRDLLLRGFAATRDRAASSPAGVIASSAVGPAPVQARGLLPLPADRPCTPADATALAAANGLADRVDDVLRMLRPTAVLSRVADFGAEGSAGRTTLAAVDLTGAEPARAGWPHPGMLRLAIDETQFASDWTSLAAARAGRVRLIRREGSGTFAWPLQLPRAWTAAVQALGLDDDQTAGWETTRTTLAERQGLAADVDPTRACDRLLGYPDERVGQMPASCVLASHGLDAEDPEQEVERRGLGIETSDWCLLAQLTRADGYAWPARLDSSRLYFWIRRDDLHASDFTGVLLLPG